MNLRGYGVANCSASAHRGQSRRADNCWIDWEREGRVKAAKRRAE